MAVTRQIIEAISNASSKEAVKQALEGFLGQPGEADTRCFGEIPTDQVETAISTEGRITKMSWGSGLGWSARRGYGAPSVEVAL